MNNCSYCDPERLQRLLNDGLSAALEAETEDHIASCVICQNELESMAAVRGWWEEASQRLSKCSGEIPTSRMGINDRGAVQPADVRNPTNSDDALSHAERPSFGRPTFMGDCSDEAYASDFAVDFLEPSYDPMVLGRLGDYEIVEVIGRGGMGIVLKGFQKELHRHVAVKVLAPHLATSGAARRRFAREAQATAAVVNPHVMAIHSVHANSKLPYLVMPYVECESLQQRLDRTGPLDLKDILRIGIQAARGLAAAHSQGLVHRDVKPANILLETNVDRVMLTDFGLARAVDDATLTRTGIIAGTPQYMSPEQANGDAIDHRSDLFSLGSVLYAMCTARPPFRAETTFGVLRRIRETDPRPVREINAEIPVWLEYFVERLLSKDPGHRWPTASGIADLLERSLAHLQQPTTVKLPDELQRPAVLSACPRKNSKSRLRFVIPLVIAAIGTTAAFSVSHGWLVSKPPSSDDRVTQPRSDAFDIKPNSPAVSDARDPQSEWNQTRDELGDLNHWMNQIESDVQIDFEGSTPVNADRPELSH